MEELDKVKRVLHEHKEEIRRRFKAEVIGIFGSLARREEGEESDVDVLVRFLPGASLFDLVGLGDYLEEKIGRKVDIVSERTIGPEFREKILKDLVPV